MAISGCYLVIARNEAISPFQGWRTDKREIAAQGILSSRGTTRSRLNLVIARDEAISVVNLPVIARDEAISPFRSRQTEKREIVSQAHLYVSSRGTKRSRLSTASKRIKERLPRREFCHREERSDLGWLGLANRKKRDCFAGSPLCVIARNEAISPFQGWRADKREIAALRSQ